MLRLFGLPTADFLGYIQAEVGQSYGGIPLRNPADLENFFKGRQEEKACFKDVEGWGGRGFQAVEVLRTDSVIRLRPLLTEDALDCASFCAARLKIEEGGGWLIESYLEQHPVVKKINPTSLNTIKIWILRKMGQEPTILGALLRVGRINSLVDNTTSGGFRVSVDLKTGVLCKPFFLKPTRTYFSKHPDHQAQIEHVQLPFWNEVKQLAATALRTFPEMHLSGLDIGITPEGPVIVELNPQPDWIAQAAMCLPSAKYLQKR